MNVKTETDMYVKGKVVISKTDALIVIDGNIDFTIPEGNLYSPGIEGESSNNYIIKGINKTFQLAFGDKSFSHEIHSKKHTEAHRFGDHCIIGTRGAGYHLDLMDIYRQADQVLFKGMNPHIIAHSIVFSSEFPHYVYTLRWKKINRIFVSGWKFTHCVGDAANALSDQWFEVYIIRDLTNSVPPPHGDTKLMTQKLKLNNVKFVFSEQLVAK